MPTDPTILLLETSGEICSVALAKGEEIIAQQAIEESNSHSTYLASMVHQVLSEGNIDAKNLNAVALSGGPGSYTGLRIGCSLAKGICFGANIPLIECSTLRALAFAAGPTSASRIVPLVDARRMDAYMGMFDPDFYAAAEEQFVTLNEEFNEQFLNNILTKLIVGSGAKKWQDQFTLLNVEVRTDVKLFASHLLPEAINKYRTQSWADLAYYEPNYIKSVYVTEPKRKF